MERPHVSLAEQYFHLESFRGLPGVIAVLLGGSVVYQQISPEDVSPESDWDGALIVKSKSDILELVHNNRELLKHTFHIVVEEFPGLKLPTPSDASWNEFDAVRFAGYTAMGNKKSVKILSLEHIESSVGTLSIISFKDRRIYATHTSDGSRCYRVHQATHLGNNLNILHDQIIFRADPQNCVHGRDVGRKSFGVTADLIVTGVWLYGREPHGDNIQKQLLERYTAACGRVVTIESFARADRFSTPYQEQLRQRLHTLTECLPRPLFCTCPSAPSTVLFGLTSSTREFQPSAFKPQIRVLPLEVVSRVSRTEEHLTSEPIRSIFSSNSRSSVLIVEQGKVEESSLKVFCKVTEFRSHELYGAQEAAKYFPQVQIPRLSVSGELLYPFFHGCTEAEYRLQFIQGGRSDWSVAETILYAELAKAEATLMAYRLSVCSVSTFDASEAPQIHRFFHSRLSGNTRLEQFYTTGVQLHDRSLPLSYFLKLPFVINGITYPSLHEIIKTATRALRPINTTSCLQAFGLGDAHGVNIMIGEQGRPDNGKDILYIDYEVAGYHSVMLDLAKLFHHDVFFDTLYADEIGDAPSIEYAYTDNAIKITLDPCTDDLSRAVFNIKKRYLIEPLRDMARTYGCDLNAWVPQLAGALLACSILTRNFNGKWDAFLRSVAVGIVLSQATTFEHLWEQCDSLRIR